MRDGQAASSKTATQTIEWCAPPSEIVLPAGMVHVWRAGLDQDTVCLRRLERNLSMDEQARAAHFRFSRDRERFVVGRGLLREILSFYLDVDARRLNFDYGTYGKPFLAEYDALRFNVSHSLDTLLIAVTYKREVGVDIERVHEHVAVEEIAETFFSKLERRSLSSLDHKAKRIAILRFWTRKEAYIKADGRGMSLPVEHIDVCVMADRVAEFDKITGEWRVLTDWTLQTLAVDPDHAAALAVEDQGWELACWQWGR